MHMLQITLGRLELALLYQSLDAEENKANSKTDQSDGHHCQSGSSDEASLACYLGNLNRAGMGCKPVDAASLGWAGYPTDWQPAGPEGAGPNSSWAAAGSSCAKES